MKIENNLFSKISLLFIGIFSLSCNFFNLFNSDENWSFIHIFLVFTAFIISYISTIREVGYSHIFSLLHITTFVFVLGGILATPFLPEMNFRISYTPIFVRFNEPVIQKVLSLYTIYICFSNIAFRHAQKKYKKTIESYNLSTRFDYLNIGKRTMLLMFPFALWYAFLQLRVGDRLLMYQLGSNEALGIPYYIRITNMLFTAGFYIIIASVPPKKIFIKYFVIYLLTLIPILISGERGEVMVPIIFFIWYYDRIYNKRISIVKMATIAFVMMAVSYIISVVRVGNTVQNYTLLAILLGFLGTSATSFALLGYYIQFKADIPDHNYPFVLDSLIGGLTGATGQSEYVLSIRSSLGHQLVYALNPNYYLNGQSTGTSFIAECYEFGTIGVLIGAIVLGYYCVAFEKYILKGKFRMIFLYLAFQLIILSPRGALLLSIYDIIKYSICFIFLKFMYNLKTS